MHHDKVRAMMPQGIKAQDQSHYVEVDPNGKWLAFSRYAEITGLICHTRFQNAWTRAVTGEVLPRLRVVHAYDKESDNIIYKQRFRLIMLCVAPINDRWTDGMSLVEYVWRRHKLLTNGWLHWEQSEYTKVQEILFKHAIDYWSIRQALQDSLFRPYAHHVGVPIQGETYGNGAILDRMEVRVTQQRGGLCVPEIRHPDVSVQLEGRDGGGA
jgi:hypothetical protein